MICLLMLRAPAPALTSAACSYRIETLARANEKLLTKEYLHLQVTRLWMR
jgi:hypothetical protein